MPGGVGNAVRAGTDGTQRYARGGAGVPEVSRSLLLVMAAAVVDVLSGPLQAVGLSDVVARCAPVPHVVISRRAETARSAGG